MHAHGQPGTGKTGHRQILQHERLVLVTKYRNPVFLVTSLKSVSSRMLRKEFEDLRFSHWEGVRLRSGSCFAGSVDGAPISAVRQHIEQQTRPSA